MVLGVAVLAYVPGTWLWGWWDQRDLRANFEEQSAAAVVVNQSILNSLQGAAENEKIKQLSLAFNKNLRDQEPIARLEVPKIGFTAIVVVGTSDASLRKGVGHLEGTPVPGMGGNFVLTGDRVLYGGPFRIINQLTTGDEIFVTTPYGRFSYIVAGNPVIYPKDDEAIDKIVASNGSEMVTLVTCDPIWNTSHRLFVQAKLTSMSLT